MKHIQQVTAIIEREGAGYVALCPELDVASQGDSIESARKNLQEAVELFLDCLLYTSPSPRDLSTSRMPSSA